MKNEENTEFSKPIRKPIIGGFLKKKNLEHREYKIF